MNKRELIARVQRHMGAGASRDAARDAVNAVLDSILQAAAEGPTAHLPQLGTFSYRLHHHRSGKGLPTISSSASSAAASTSSAHATSSTATASTTSATAPQPEDAHLLSSRRLSFRPARRLQQRLSSTQNQITAAKK